MNRFSASRADDVRKLHRSKALHSIFFLWVKGYRLAFVLGVPQHGPSLAA